MKRKLTWSFFVVLLVGVLVSAVSAKDVPWFNSTNGNPYTDGSGDQWAVYQIDDTAGMLSYKNWFLYTAMTWNTNKWAGFDLGFSGHPTYLTEGSVGGGDFKQILTAPGAGSGSWRQSALVYKPSHAGRYSFNGKLEYIDWSTNQVGNTVEFGKFDDSGNVWTSLYSITLNSGSVLDLDGVSKLQNIAVGIGERLVVVNNSDNIGWWAAAALYFRNDISGNRVGIDIKKNIDYTYVPWFSSTNPYTQANGDTWSIYQVAPSSYDLSYQTWSSYQAMTLNTNKWVGFDLGWSSYPFFGTEGSIIGGDFRQVLTAPGAGSDMWRQSTMVYEPNESGRYSWAGDLNYIDWSGNSNVSNVVFGKFYDSDKNWETLYSVTLNSGDVLNLDSISKLQNIAVGAGEKLVVVNNSGWWAIAGIYFRNDSVDSRVAMVKESTVKIKYVPWFNNPNGNPYTEIDNDMWSVYQISDTGGINSYLNLGAYTAMTWNTDNWVGFDLGWNYPFYRSEINTENLILTSPGAGSGKWRQSALVYDPKVKGTYSLTGVLHYRDWSGAGYAGGITFVKIVGDVNSTVPITKLYSVKMSHNSKLVLDDIPQLQDIYIGDSGRLGIVVNTEYDTWWGIAAVYFHCNQNQINTSVGIISNNVHPTCCDYDGTVCMPADINHDCKVDMWDFTIFAEQWLQCNDPQNCN